MFEIHTNDHHYKHKAIFLGALILILGVTMWTNVFAQRAITMSVPTDFTITPINTSQPSWEQPTVVKSDGIVGVYSGSTKPQTGSGTTPTVVASTGVVEGQVSPSTQTGVVQSTGAQPDVVIIYARKIEALIAVKGQETRSNMLITMNKFLAKYTPDHPVYSTIQRMVDIIKLGEVAQKLEYCTQFDESYNLELFGQKMKIHSTIKYSAAAKRCEMTFQYPDQSVHSCRLDEDQKLLLSEMIIDKQGLKFDSVGLVEDNSSNTFESVLDGYLRDTTCFESQKAVIPKQTTVVSSTGSIETGTTTTTNRRQFTKK